MTTINYIHQHIPKVLRDKPELMRAKAPKFMEQLVKMALVMGRTEKSARYQAEFRAILALDEICQYWIDDYDL